MSNQIVLRVLNRILAEILSREIADPPQGGYDDFEANVGAESSWVDMDGQQQLPPAVVVNNPMPGGGAVRGSGRGVMRGRGRGRPPRFSNFRPSRGASSTLLVPPRGRGRPPGQAYQRYDYIDEPPRSPRSPRRRGPRSPFDVSAVIEPRCEICDSVFSGNNDLHRHMRDDHRVYE